MSVLSSEHEMSAVIADMRLKDEIIAQRRASGSDRWDEVWEGVYVLMPLPNDEHQGLVGDLTALLKQCVEWQGLGLVRPGVNVSDRVVDWAHNYRCPDVVVFLEGTTAENHDTFRYGGPDFAVEIVSPHDGELQSAGRSIPTAGDVLSSEIVPLSFRWLDGPSARPQMQVDHKDTEQVWTL